MLEEPGSDAGLSYVLCVADKNIFRVFFVAIRTFRLSKNIDYGFVPSGYFVAVDFAAFHC